MKKKKIVIYIEIQRKERICPDCGRKTNRVHDYRWQRVKDMPAFGKEIELRVHKRRFRSWKGTVSFVITVCKV